MRIPRLPCCCLAVLLLNWVASPLALAEVPFYSRNMSPLVQIYGLPAAVGPELPTPGQMRGQLVVNTANNFSRDVTATETILLDGESSRIDIVLRYGFGSRLELGVALPYVSQSGGVFDSFIDGWHDSFGLPDGGRSNAASGRFHYLYQRGGLTLLDITESASGPGDLSLSAGLKLYERRTPDGDRLASLRLGVKLPTGDSDHLLGSGATDVSLALAASDSGLLTDKKLTLFASGGLLLVGEGDVLPTLQRRVVCFGTLAGALRLNSWLAFKLQLDSHSPFYEDSALRQLDAWAAQLLLGAAIDLPGHVLLDLGVAEDIAVDTGPDIVFHLALVKKF